VVTVDRERCTACGICLKRFGDYCLTETEGKPAVDYAVCNMCQKCIALCPRGAFLMNGTVPEKIKGRIDLHADMFEAFLARRRSTKKFKDKPVPRRVLERITAAAAYAPNQNKDISLLVIDDPALIGRVNDAAVRFTRRWYRILYSPNPIALLARLFMGKRQYRLMKRKMEFGHGAKDHVVYEHTQAIIAAHGNHRVPMTGPSAPYLLAHMLLMAETLGVGSTILESVKLTLNLFPSLKKVFGFPRGSKVFGVLSLGYSDEKIVNIPRGYRVPVSWNMTAAAPANRPLKT
jgi:nitroreductase/NAD-dependent dihydropyrimidine dehydrogenase PreA subunit